jgi:sn-glycerol 3-phosphate transport system ATP-binding protein
VGESTVAEIVLNSVSKKFPDGTVAVADVDLSVADGEFVILVGPSGCGKSTLLRMIAGLESITAGAVSIDGKVVNAIGPTERDIAMVFQNYALYPHMKVYDNMAYGLRNRGTPKDEIDRRVRATAKTLELEHLLERRPRELSGGQRQRVAMGRAIVRNPKVFLFDEPLSNLDAKLRHSVRQDIRALQRRLGMTVVYVTHDQTEAMGMADRIVLLKDGRIEQVGRPADLYQHPATSFTATFVGSPPMSLLPAERLPATLRPQVVGSTAHPLVVGVRPEHLEIGPEDARHLSAHVLSYEFLGAETLIYLDCDGTELIARVPGEVELANESAVGVRWAPENAHVFETGSGRRVQTADIDRRRRTSTAGRSASL